MKNLCGDCKFWQSFDDAQEDESVHDDAEVGTCRRFPPVWIGNHQIENNTVQELRVYAPGKWDQPVTTNYDGCGEFQSATIVGASFPVAIEKRL